MRPRTRANIESFHRLGAAPLSSSRESTRDVDEARALLGETCHVLDALTERLRKRDSIYASVFRALGALADRSAAVDGTVETPATEDTSLEAIDKAWAEEQVVFGPDPDAGCPAANDMLGRMAVPPETGLNKGDQQ